MKRVLIIFFLSLCLFQNLIWAQSTAFNLSDSIAVFNELKIQKELELASGLALKIGDYYTKIQDLKTGKEYYDFAFTVSKKKKDRIMGARSAFKIANTLKNMAESGKYSLNKEQDLYEESYVWFKKAVNFYSSSSLKESYEYVITLIELGEMQYYRGENQKSANNLKAALVIAQKNKYFDLAFRATKLLRLDYDSLKDPAGKAYYQSVYEYYRDYFLTKDSVTKQSEAIQQLEVEKEEQNIALKNKEEILKERQLQLNQQLEIARLNRERIEAQNQMQRYMFWVIGIIFSLLVFALLSYASMRRAKKKLESKNRKILKQKQVIEARQEELRQEKAKSDKLLLNVLPKPVADELKSYGKVKPRHYRHVSVLFSDFKGFTDYASKMPAPKMISELETCFSAFDRIIAKYNLEKIKTIGDGYMCAGGVPLVNKSNPLDAANAALEMIDFMKNRKRKKEAMKEPFFEMRIGINTGSVIAGVVGQNKFAYDIWGDTVNLASRLETNSEEWRINISKSTYEHIRDKFFFTYRGKIEVRNRGSIEMYFLDGKVKYS